MNNEASQKAFEAWATGILGDNPNWPESGDGELARQSWNASRKALEAEQAQTVEPCGGCGQEDSDKRCIGCLHPFAKTGQPAEPTVKKPLSTERAGLIAWQHDLVKKYISLGYEGLAEMCKQTADMLEADAQELTNAFERVDHWSERYLDARNKLLPYQLIEQQVEQEELSDGEIYSRMSKAVNARLNQREPLSDEQIDAVTLDQWGEMNGYPLAAHRAFARAIEAKAQQVEVPAGYAPMSVEQVADWYASENGLEDCDMCKYDDFCKVVQAVEARHGITPQGDKT